MTEWILKTEHVELENRYRNEWLRYKNQATYDNKVTFDAWIKHKLDEEKENKIDSLRKEWESYKTNITSTSTDLDEWLAKRFAVQRAPIKGGFKKCKARKTLKKRKTHKKNNKKNNKNKNRYTYIKTSKKKGGNKFDASTTHPASIIL